MELTRIRNFDYKMMAYLWFKNDVNYWEGKRLQTDAQQVLNVTLMQTRGKNVRATRNFSGSKTLEQSSRHLSGVRHA